MAGRNKKYFTSTGLSRITQQKDQEGFVSDVTKQWLGKLSDENREVTEPLIAGIERHKLKEFLTDSEHIDKIFSSVLSPDTFKKKSGFSDPPKMAETYSKLGTNFYKFFEDLVSGKTQKGSSLIENAISYTGEINQMISTKSSFNQISTLTRVIDAARRLKTELNKGNFSVFDIESLGGQNKYGFQELDDITEFNDKSSV
jgi:hypothetical protein